MPRLVSCEACSRHVFATESTCPFCQSPVSVPARPMARAARGMSRAQRLAIAAALAAPLSACADESINDDAAETDSASEELTAVPLYGVPVAGTRPTPVGGKGGVGGSGGKGGAGGEVFVPLYGVPVAGSPVKLPIGGRIAVPLYGASPVIELDAAADSDEE